MVSRILDATSFYAGLPFSSQEASFTTPEILNEIKHIKRSYSIISTLIESKRLQILEPEKRFIEIVKQKAVETGDFNRLSQEDISVIALSLQLEGELMTDDFAITNVAKHLNVKVLPILTSGTDKKRWEYSCSGCKKSFSKVTICPICGNKLMRRKAK